MARLGELLVARGAVDAGRIEEALDAQVIYGGRLGTNLLESGALGEQALAEALGELHGGPALWGPIGVDPRALALLPPDRAERLLAVPLRLEGRRLSVLMADPRDLRRRDELAFATGKEIRPVVVAESRLHQLLRLHCGWLGPARGVEALSTRVARGASTRTPAPTPAAAGAADLMDEAAFQALYDRVGSATPTPAPVPTPSPAAAAALDLVARLAELQPLVDQLGTLPLPVGPAPGGPGPGADPGRGAEPAGPLLEPGDPGLRPTPAGGVEAPPLTFEEAVQALAGVGDRDQIARVVLRFARSRFRRAVLLTVRDGVAAGWEGLGHGIHPQAVTAVRLDLAQPGVFHTVVASRAHFLGPLQKTPANVAFLRALGGGAPKNSFAMPVLARGRVVNVLYGDDGRGQLVDAAGVGDLLILAARITRSWEALLARPH